MSPTFDATDWDNAQSESGVVHEATSNTDHNDAGTLKQGYKYASPSYTPFFFWPLDEDTGSTAYDVSGNNNDGNHNGALLGQTGLLGTTAVSYDASDYTSSGEIPSNFNYNNSYTLNFWINTTLSGSINLLWDIRDSNYNGPFIEHNYGNIRFNAGDNNNTDITGSVTTNDGNWHMITCVYDSGNEAALYVDGSLDASTSDGGSKDSNDTMAIGIQTGGSSGIDGTYTWSGTVSLFAQYDVLSSSEIQYLYDVVATSGSLTTQYQSV